MDIFENSAAAAAPKKLLVSSSKGGIGKSTVSSGIARALSEMGKRVLLIDLDCGNGSLDLFLGVENDALYNWGDVALNRVNASKAVMSVPGTGNLFFVPAPSDVAVIAGGDNEGVTPDGRSIISGDRLVAVLEELSDICRTDYVICDTAAGIDIPLIIAGRFADRALIASSHQPSSMRAAETTASKLEAAGVSWIRMVVSAFELSGAYEEKRAGLIDIIDSSRVRIIGVVPFDRELMLAQERGEPAPEKCPSHSAFSNIAKRLEDTQVRLFKGVKGISRRKIY